MATSSSDVTRGGVKQLIDTLPQHGIVEHILLRPGRKLPMVAVTHALLAVGQGLEGDYFNGSAVSKRQVTLFQAENLAVLASLLHKEVVAPEELRRNLIIRHINLHALSGRQFQIGSAVLEGAGQCHPCSRMETALGAGGFNAMRGIGGLCAKVLKAGEIKVGDRVFAL